MLKPDSVEYRQLIDESTELQKAGDFDEAICLVERRFGEMGRECLIEARCHTVTMAREGGLNEVALRHASELAKIAPEHPILKVTHHPREGGLNEVALRRSIS
jgi:hypothetical protein